ncbi:hypothetical protein Droror1_Dr00027787 [Drosera rotundifolia]
MIDCTRASGSRKSGSISRTGTEKGKRSVSERELWILHCMLYGLNDQSAEFRVYTGAFVARRLIYHAMVTTGGIVVGGLITPLAEYFKIDLSAIEKDRLRDSIDITLLKNSMMLKKEGKDYCLYQRDVCEPKRLLPLLAREQNVIDPRNWGLSRL